MTKKKISRAGIIPYYISDPDNTIYMLFMRPSNPKFGDFFFSNASRERLMVTKHHWRLPSEKEQKNRVCFNRT